MMESSSPRTSSKLEATRNAPLSLSSDNHAVLLSPLRLKNREKKMELADMSMSFSALLTDFDFDDDEFSGVKLNTSKKYPREQIPDLALSADELSTLSSTTQRSSSTELSPKRSCSRSSPELFSKQRKSVKFGGLTVHEHSLRVGDHSWKHGPPLALSEQVSLKHMDLDEFERSREGERRNHRNLLIKPDDRRRMLTFLGGYSDSDLRMMEQRKTQMARKLSPTRKLSPQRLKQSSLRRKVPPKSSGC